MNAIAPSRNLVSTKENLDFRLMSVESITKGDCIRYTFTNPYFTDAPETYKAFDTSVPYSQPCEVNRTIIHLSSYSYILT